MHLVVLCTFGKDFPVQDLPTLGVLEYVSGADGESGLRRPDFIVDLLILYQLPITFAVQHHSQA